MPLDLHKLSGGVATHIIKAAAHFQSNDNLSVLFVGFQHLKSELSSSLND